MSFDRLAPWYRTMELLLAGPLLQRCRTAFLEEALGTRHALLVGEGPGRYLIELARANPDVEIVCVDSSARMLEVARNRLRSTLPKRDRVEFVRADLTTWAPEHARFDLVATHFFLDCFRPEQLARVIGNLAGGAARGGLWVLSDFREPERGWRRIRARLILRCAYAFFRYVTRLPASWLTSPDGYLRGAGFQLKHRSVFHHGLLHADVWRKEARDRFP